MACLGKIQSMVGLNSHGREGLPPHEPGGGKEIAKAKERVLLQLLADARKQWFEIY
jgi:hypothetical protein